MNLAILSKLFVAILFFNSSVGVPGKLQLPGPKQELQDTLQIAEAFSDNMVLQREKPVTIWGRAAGQIVTVQFAGQQKTTVADTTGKWQVVLAPLQVSATLQSLTVQSGTTITLNNILVGDIWRCCGQCHLEWDYDKNCSVAAIGLATDCTDYKN